MPVSFSTILPHSLLVPHLEACQSIQRLHQSAVTNKAPFDEFLQADQYVWAPAECLRYVGTSTIQYLSVSVPIGIADTRRIFGLDRSVPLSERPDSRAPINLHGSDSTHVRPGVRGAHTQASSSWPFFLCSMRSAHTLLSHPHPTSNLPNLRCNCLRLVKRFRERETHVHGLTWGGDVGGRLCSSPGLDGTVRRQ